MAYTCTVWHDSYPLKQPFVIAHGSRTQADVVRVRISDGKGNEGNAESVPYARYKESIESVLAQIAAWQESIVGSDPEQMRLALQTQMPPGAARNAIDCALWDLRSKQARRALHALAGVDQPPALPTAFTLSIGAPETVAREAIEMAHMPLLKIKCAGDGQDVPRVAAIRQARPDADIIIDANESWGANAAPDLCRQMAALGVSMIEQPLPAGKDEALRTFAHPVPICADESCHTSQDLPSLKGKYDMVNIKLDKTGGLTEALSLYNAAREHGFQVMVGCMVASELGIAPARLIAQYADVIDLDGPLLLLN
ncbi:MAG: dipeptide epimerase [bacterium]|nr:dipeptide epimerase [bacterium]